MRRVEDWERERLYKREVHAAITISQPDSAKEAAFSDSEKAS
jgi:hypothetical protein